VESKINFFSVKKQQTKGNDMQGAYTQFIKSKGYKPSCAVDQAAAKHKEDCELRLALIMNNAHPDYKNGHPKHKEKTGAK